ncbi:MAG TPA: hypothetical protein DCG72_11205 [Gammaproteobacteria bacterium]|nr:hypothetical protein [Gammaproteobacteria bacterium]
MAIVGWLFQTAIGSFWGRAVSVALLAWGALAVNNVYQRSVGGDRREAQIIDKSNEVAKQRDAQIRKIRSSIKPSNAWQRLRREYSDAH